MNIGNTRLRTPHVNTHTIHNIAPNTTYRDKHERNKHKQTQIWIHHWTTQTKKDAQKGTTTKRAAYGVVSVHPTNIAQQTKPKTNTAENKEDTPRDCDQHQHASKHANNQSKPYTCETVKHSICQSWKLQTSAHKQHFEEKSLSNTS